MSNHNITVKPGQTVLVQKMTRDDGTVSVYVKVGNESKDGTKLLMPDDTCWTPIAGCDEWLQHGYEALLVWTNNEIPEPEQTYNDGYLTSAEIHHIIDAVKTEGSYDPDSIMYLFEEWLTHKSYQRVYDFLGWVSYNNKTFGHGNIQQVYHEFALATGLVSE